MGSHLQGTGVLTVLPGPGEIPGGVPGEGRGWRHVLPVVAELDDGVVGPDGGGAVTLAERGRHVVRWGLPIPCPPTAQQQGPPEGLAACRPPRQGVRVPPGTPSPSPPGQDVPRRGASPKSCSTWVRMNSTTMDWTRTSMNAAVPLNPVASMSFDLPWGHSGGAFRLPRGRGMFVTPHPLDPIPSTHRSRLGAQTMARFLACMLVWLL